MIGDSAVTLKGRMSLPAASPLIVTADDWGYSERYNAGILTAVRALAVDAVSAMVLRPACDPAPLLAAGVEVGLHIEIPEGADRRALVGEPSRQLARFERIFGRPPAYIDGHHHCHAAAPLASSVEDSALELGVAVRAIDADHHLHLRRRGIRCVDRLIGRSDERDPAIPDLIATALEEGRLPPGTTEWAVHPGYADPGADSSYDAGREQDLGLLLDLAAEEILARGRFTHREALGG